LASQQSGPIRLLFSYGGLCGRFPQLIGGGALIYVSSEFTGGGGTPGVFNAPPGVEETTLVGFASFANTPIVNGVTLSWVYGGDGDLPSDASGVVILRSTSDFPTHPGGPGEIVFQGTGNTFSDTTVNIEDTYFYSAWVEYPSSGYSDRATTKYENFWKLVYEDAAADSAVAAASHLGKLYASIMDRDVLESESGATWVDVESDTNVGARDVSGIISFGGAMLGAPSNDRTHRSTDDGRTWTEVDSAAGAGFHVFGSFVYKHNGSTLLRRSADGISWSNMGLGDARGMVLQDSTIYATTNFGVGPDNAAVASSPVTDGNNWSLAIDMSGISVPALGLIESHDGALYYTNGVLPASLEGRLFKSTDGSSFTEVTLPVSSPGPVWALKSHRGRLFIGIGGDSTKIWWTTDGTSWTLAVDLTGEQTVAGLFSTDDFLYALVGKPKNIQDVSEPNSTAGAKIYRSPNGLGDLE